VKRVAPIFPVSDLSASLEHFGSAMVEESDS